MSLKEIPFCDVFHPTSEEFNNFENYVEKISLLTKSGIAKIVPPKCWKPRLDNYIDLEFTVPKPIEQIVCGKDGIYELLYLQRESRTLSKYKKLVEGYDKFLKNDYEKNEKQFWKTIKFSSPLYGADAPGSLFDKKVKWNLSEIQTILKDGLDKEIKGVTSPYLYFGSWKAMFAWHKEDLDLCSINYLHFGKPKFWYGINSNDEEKFNQFLNLTYPDASRECPEFMRHKTYLVHPGLIHSKGIKIFKCLQNPGEFVITFGKCYHAGFNMGFNCAEAVNFATKSWVNSAIKVKSCECQKDSVKIDMGYFLRNLVKRKKIDIKELENMELKPNNFSKEIKSMKNNIDNINKNKINMVEKKKDDDLLKKKRRSNNRNSRSKKNNVEGNKIKRKR